MKVRAALPMNAAGMAAERDIQGNGRQARTADSRFGVPCKVTISQEGRRRGKQQAGHTEQSAQSARTERMLLRRQEESEREQETRQGYIEELKEIDKTIKALNNSYNKEEDKYTVEKKQEVLRAMMSQKQLQMEENQRRAEEAQQMAMQFAKYQGEIDENNRDLLTLLKSIEETEKAEEEQEDGEVTGEGNGSTSDAQNAAGDMIRSSAVQFTVSSVKREWDVEEALAGLGDEGHRLLDRANAVTRSIVGESDSIRAALGSGSLTDDAIAERISHLQDGLGFDYQDVDISRRHGLQMIQDAQECKIRHLADDPLKGMSETKKSMMMSAVDAVYGEAVQGRLGEASRELEDEVEKLTDERNSVDRIRQDEEEYEEEQAEAAKEQEPLQTEEEYGRGSL